MKLTNRQWEIIALIAEGLGNHEIADRFAITIHVVKNTVRTIYDETGMSGRVELALWYARSSEGLSVTFIKSLPVTLNDLPDRARIPAISVPTPHSLGVQIVSDPLGCSPEA